MKINYKKKIKGLCYVEDVLDKNGMKVFKILFDNNCKLIDEANEYLRELRITRLSGYNSINIVARDLCHFYNFLLISNKKVEEIDYKWLSEFINYLTKISISKNKYSIENSILTRLNLNVYSKLNNVIGIHKFGSLSDASIYRIFNRTIDYLEYLHAKGKFIDERLLKNLMQRKARSRFVKANCIYTNLKDTYLNISNQIMTDEQIDRIVEESSKTNDYERLLYFILLKTGVRIGEALGLQIIESDNIKNLSGDIYYGEEAWKIKVVYRRDNNFDSLSKSHSSRIISIKESDKFEFELLLERYLKFRKRKLKNRKCKWLFITNRATKLSQNTAYERFKRTLEKACPESVDKLTLHSFRHTFCTKELLNGTPLELVAKMAGHADPVTTYKINVHYSDEDIREIR